MSSSRLLKRNQSLSRILPQNIITYQYRYIIISSSLQKRNNILTTTTSSTLFSESPMYRNNIFILNHNKSLFCSKPPPTSTSSDDNEPKSDEDEHDEHDEHEHDEQEEKEEKEDRDWEYIEVEDEIIKQRNYRILSWRTVIATIVVFGIGTIIFQQRVHRHRQKQKEPQFSSFGEAAVGGGEWKMTDMNNKQITNIDLNGRYQVVYFGFTFCPDVCPRELTKMATAMQLLEKRGFKIGIEGDILPVFVSVDPKRDTPELIRKYIRQFHPAIYGLTGTPQQVATFAKAYKAYFSTPGPGENSDDYIVDHVTMMYIMDRAGQYIGHISTLENADEMASKMSDMIKDVGHSGGFLGKWFKDPTQLIKEKK